MPPIGYWRNWLSWFYARTRCQRGELHGLYARAEASRKQSQQLAEQLHATQRKASENWRLIRDSWDKTEQAQARRLAARTDPDRLRYSAYARLQARLASLPVIEQAKGIIMAQFGLPEEQAFEALRRRSQRENVKVRELAASIVARAERSAAAQRQAGPVPSAAPSRGGEVIPRRGSGAPRNRYRESA